MKVKNHLILVYVLVILLMVAVLSFVDYRIHRDEIMHGVDEKLRTATTMVHQILTPEYHDRIVDENTIAASDYLNQIDRFNKLCQELDIQYLWSNLILPDRIVFTSSTSSSKDVSQGDHALFFDTHSDPGAFTSVLQRKAPSFTTFRNEWGAGRMLLVPHVDSQGRTYVIGASVSIQALELALKHWLQLYLLIALLVVGVGSYLSILLARKITEPIASLSKMSAQIAQGNYEAIPKERGLLNELHVLDSNMRVMSAKLQQQTDVMRQQVDSKQQELLEKNLLLTGLIENSAEGIMLVNSKGVVEIYNPACAEIFGFSREEVIGQPLDYILGPGPDGSHAHFIAHAEQFEPRMLDRPRVFSALRKNGEEFSLELLISKIERPKVYYLGIMRDVTAQVEMQYQLEQTRAQAIKANKLKSQFLSSMSHELRTPLNSILGFGQLLELDESLGKSQKEYVQEIMHGGEHLLNLIEDVLDLAKIEAGKIILNIRPIDVHGLVTECLQTVQHGIVERGLRKRIDTDSLQHHVLADYSRLKQVLLNYLSNAIKYNSDDGEIGVSGEVCDGNKLRIWVTDSGEGIAEEDQEKLFKPFERLGRENSTVPGSGIGLSISKRLIDAMDGQVGCRSVPRQGSQFYVELKLSTDPAAAGEGASTEKPQQALDLSAKVLYVEDNRANANLMRKLFRQLPQAELIVAEDGHSCIELAQASQPNLILMDINLPDMSGIDAFDRLQQIPETVQITVIALSADAMPDEVDHALQRGFKDYVTKPFDMGELLEKIKRYLESPVQ